MAREFTCHICQLYILLSEMNLLALGHFLLYCLSSWVLSYFNSRFESFVRLCGLQTLMPMSSFSFHPLNKVSQKAQVYDFNIVQFMLFFLWTVLLVPYLKTSHHASGSQIFLCLPQFDTLYFHFHSLQFIWFPWDFFFDPWII